MDLITYSLAKKYTDKAVEGATGAVGVYKTKGSVNTYADLPLSAKIGDVYNVLDEYGQNYVWTELAGIVQAAPLLRKEIISQLFLIVEK